jgi:RNA polymerase sigma-70 factor (ECF subfamily)
MGRRFSAFVSRIGVVPQSLPVNGTIAPPAAAVDARAFEILVRLHHRRLLAYGLALTQRADAAEDLVQEALLVAHRDLSKFDPSRDFAAWVRGILRMKYLEWARRQRMQALDPSVLESVEAEHRAWDRAVEEGREDVIAAVRECLRLLGGHAGEAIQMFYGEKRPCTEIAVRMGTTEVVIRKRLQRARESLADCIRRRAGEEKP